MTELPEKAPPEQAPPPAPRASHPHPFWPVLLTLGVVGMVAVAFAVGFLFPRATSPAESAVVARPTPAILVTIRDLSRLETGEVHVEKVIDLTDTQSRFFGLLQGTDALLLVAVGRATVGIDLSKLGDGDISMDPATGIAKLRLPSPELLSVALDEEKTYVYTRTTSVLARRNEHLETQARKEAAAAIEKAARSSDAMGRARAQAERQLRALLTPLGVSQIEVTFRD
jgi:hypothetical protein